MDVSSSAQVTVMPRCPVCDSADTAIHRSQKIAEGVNHEGHLRAAQKQYRRCRDCGETFGAIKIGEKMVKQRKSRWTGPGVSGS